MNMCHKCVFTYECAHLGVHATFVYTHLHIDVHVCKCMSVGECVACVYVCTTTPVGATRMCLHLHGSMHVPNLSNAKQR